PVRIFISYAREDLEHLKALEKQLANLKRQNEIQIWTDQKLLASTEWEPELLRQLREAHIVLVLMSPDMMASAFIHDIELKEALERHQRGEVRVLPVLVRPTDLKGHPLAKFKGLPRNFKPVTEWSNRDAAWLAVVEGLREVIASRGTSNAASTPMVKGQREGEDDPAGSPRSSRVLRRWPVLSAGALIVIGGLTMFYWGENPLEPDLTQAVTTEAPTSACEELAPDLLPPILPLTLIWLEDPDDPDFTKKLEAPALLRHHLKSLGAELVRQGVNAIALDLFFSAPEGLSDLEAFLSTAHQHTPRIPVMAIRTEQDSIRPECHPSTAQACFDVLAHAGLIAGGLGPGQQVEALDPCLDGIATPSRVVGQWLKQHNSSATHGMQTEGRCTREPRLCIPERLLEAPPWKELSSGEYLKNPSPVSIVLIGIRSDQDKFTVKTSAEPLHNMDGLRLHAAGAAHYSVQPH
ncbi:MAG: toll/interleukin-1 receptor domain-containing protein, partial [Myxococcota bacterium]